MPTNFKNCTLIFLLLDIVNINSVRCLKESAHILGYEDFLSIPSIEINTNMGAANKERKKNTNYSKSSTAATIKT